MLEIACFKPFYFSSGFIAGRRSPGSGELNLEKCIEVYYKTHEIGNRDIEEIFGVKKVKACRLKKLVKELMKKKGTRIFDSLKVNTEVAFEAWGLDIDDMERRVTKLRKLGLL